jgi:integrase
MDVLEAVAQGKHHTQATRHMWAACFRRILHYLSEEHGAPRLWQVVPKVSKTAPRAVTVTNEEREKLLRAAPANIRCWILLCSDLAIRSTTSAQIAPKHYDREAGTVTFVTKFGSAQTLPVTAELAALFASAKQTEDPSVPYVALLSRLGRIDPKTLRKNFKRLREKVGINRQITPHDLRRTTAVKMLELTHDIRAVQALLGHRDLATTLYYLDHRNTPVAVANLELAKLNPHTEAIQ